MNHSLIAVQSVEIKASAAAVWEVLTNPKKIKEYLFGTKTKTDWKVGSPILFQGEYEGHKYKDKGNVIAKSKNRVLVYTYWSGFSGLEDAPANYCVVTYQIEPTATGTVLFTWKQVGFSSKEGHKHAQEGLAGMLEVIKRLAE